MSGALSASAGVEDFEDGIVGVVLLLGLLRSGLLGRGLLLRLGGLLARLGIESLGRGSL